MKIKSLFGRIFTDRFFCGIDVGQHKVKACLSKVKDAENMEILAVSEAATRGFRDGLVNDFSEFSACIGAVMEALVKKAQVPVRDVYLGVGGCLVEVRSSRAVVPLVERGNKVITPHDVSNARRQARLLGAKLDEEVICDFVRHFMVDDVNIALNPVGLYGRKLEVDVMLAVAANSRLRNIGKAVKQAGFEVIDFFFNVHALGESLLDKQKRADGCVLVSIGAITTEVLVYKEGLLKQYAKLDFGGNNLTRRIAAALDVSFDLAEDMKKSYARALDSRIANGDEILVKKEQAFVPVKRVLLNEAVEADIKTFTESLASIIEQSGYKGQLKSGLIMVGGTALLPGFLERVETLINTPVSMGCSINGLNNAVLYCTATSIAERAYKGTSRYLCDTRKPKDFIRFVKGKAEELSNEYF